MYAVSFLRCKIKEIHDSIHDAWRFDFKRSILKDYRVPIDYIFDSFK